ncbi:hypothetical protein L3X38_031711 [Prunus dulcis]|uniref:RRM domain-containing protein n=1 Tax=Prunus dulcis TaxID=3755 RepID=A0AAD4VE41_PRUDU|nr:hypothetical protein L3X38_031711 [Prunus dulcis]
MITLNSFFGPKRSSTTGRSRSFDFDFITFNNEKVIREAIEGMNNQNLDGHNITINEAQSCGSGSGGNGGYSCRGGCEGYGCGHSLYDSLYELLQSPVRHESDIIAQLSSSFVSTVNQ